MHAQCPSCGLVYEREPGYFLGAMYFSYAMAIPILASLMWIIHHYTAWSLVQVWGAALVAYIPFIPFVFRASRSLWLHVDHRLDPEPPSHH